MSATALDRVVSQAYKPEDYVAATRELAALRLQLQASESALTACKVGLKNAEDDTDYCYVCDNHPSHGHAKDCPMSPALTPQEGEG